MKKALSLFLALLMAFGLCANALALDYKITLGNEVVVGMASNVTKSLPDHAVAYGNPAKEKEQLNHIIR